MAFTKLSVHEKEAFFGLLDEYFQSRPEIFGQTSTVQRTFAGGSNASSPMPNIDVGQAVSMGRIAAASLAFSGGQNPTIGSRSTEPLPAPARRTVDPPSLPGSEVDKLVTTKSSMFSALKKSSAPSGVVSIPPAFGPPKNTFGPPPVRRVTSDTPATSGGALRQAQVAQPESEVADGEWAEVLYDYSSEDPGDLTIKAGTRVRVTAKSSEDWWTGQIEGQEKEGLFPASYVTLL